MNAITRSHYFQAIPIALLPLSTTTIALLSMPSAIAQITPDRSLGAEQSRLNPNVTIDGKTSNRIEGGARRGANLFHSFEQFNINEGQRLYFANPEGIRNIFSRITGGDRTNILGTLGVEGNANLFLLNPNGIFFGRNATLDIRGSFLATTANGVRFGNQGSFSTVNPDAPPLLTVNPNALFFTQTSGRIENQSVAPAGADLRGNPRFGLQVPDNRSLLLVGGEVTLDGGGLQVANGYISLAGMSGTGEINLDANGDRFSLNVPANLLGADVTLKNGAIASTNGEGGGRIQTWGRRIIVRDGSRMSANTLGRLPGEGITSNASEQIQAIGESATGQRSSISAETESSGNAGTIVLNAPILQILAGARVSTLTRGRGTGGDITVNAPDQILVSGFTRNRNSGSDLFAQAGRNATGNAGTLSIRTRSLTVDEGGQVAVSTNGRSNAGRLNITAEDVRVQGDPLSIIAANTNAAGIGTGNAGELVIQTRRLLVRDGAEISASTSGSGSAGRLQINATESVQVSNRSSNGSSSSIVAGTYGLLGKAGELQINTPVLRVFSGGEVATPSLGSGAGGRLTIQTNRFLISDGFVGASSLGTGLGGNVTVYARQELRLNGDNSNLLSQTRGAARAGNIVVRTPNLILQNGALIATNTNGDSNAGNIDIRSDRILMQRGASISTTSAGAGAAGRLHIAATDSIQMQGAGSIINSGAAGTGDAGNIRISTPFLSARNQARISSDTIGRGNAGQVFLNLGQLQLREGALISSGTANQGNGGTVRINAADSIQIIGGKDRNSRTSDTISNATSNTTSNGTPSGLFAETQGAGNAGDLVINTPSLVVAEGAQIRAGNQLRSSGRGGDLNITAEQIRVSGTATNRRFPSALFASTRGTGSAGNVQIRANQFIVENGARVSAEALNQGREAGSVLIDTTQLAVRNRGAITVSSRNGQAGNLQIRANVVHLNRGNLTAEIGQASGAEIRLQAVEQLLLENNSLISAQAFTNATGGNITVDVRDGFIVAMPNQNSDIIAIASQGRGGNIAITTQGIFGIDPQRAIPRNQTNDIDASSQFSQPGTVTITRPDVDPTQGLTELPSEPRAPQPLASCQASGGEGDRFITTGSGGLPIQPDEPLSQLESLDDLQLPDAWRRVEQREQLHSSTITEAEDWIVNSEGKVELVAERRSAFRCSL
jgi:filamentous hemagglutinin family protein